MTVKEKLSVKENFPSGFTQFKYYAALILFRRYCGLSELGLQIKYPTIADLMYLEYF
jgi:hypothetical protein